MSAIGGSKFIVFPLLSCLIHMESHCTGKFGSGFKECLGNKEAICTLLGYSRPRNTESKWLDVVNLKF